MGANGFVLAENELLGCTYRGSSPGGLALALTSLLLAPASSLLLELLELLLSLLLLLLPNKKQNKTATRLAAG